MNQIIIFFIGAVLSHMHMQYPPAEGTAANLGNGISRNYDINSPVGSKRYSNPCGYQARGIPAAEFTAGQDIPVKMGGSATHGGGHCQFGFSYDRKNFAITHTVTGTCPLEKEYKVPIPKNAPNGVVTFIWGWNNKVGNREMYINCAEVNIVGGQDYGSINGKELLVSNIQGAPNSGMFPEDGFNKDLGDVKLNAQKPISISPNGSRYNNKQPGSVEDSLTDDSQYQKELEVEADTDNKGNNSRQINKYYNSNSGKLESKAPYTNDKRYNERSGRNYNKFYDNKPKNSPWQEDDNRVYVESLKDYKEYIGPIDINSENYGWKNYNQKLFPDNKKDGSNNNQRAGLNFVKTNAKKKCKEVGCTGWNLMWNPLNENYDFYTY